MKPCSKFDGSRELFKGVVAGEKVDHIGGFGVVREGQGDIALQASGVVIESRPVTNFRLVGSRAEIDGVVCERTFVDAAATCCSRDHEGQAEREYICRIVRDGFAVASHRVGGTVEDLGRARIFVGECPVPVRLGACVAAVIT